jgi:hypothetical protein
MSVLGALDVLAVPAPAYGTDNVARTAKVWIWDSDALKASFTACIIALEPS